MSAGGPAGADAVLATLVRAFAEAEAALQRHVSGQVDGIIDQHGQSLLLRSAQLQLLSSEDELRRQAEIQTAILDALPSHVALVDESGVIMAVNASWAAFTAANPAHCTTFALGQDFLAMCARDPEGEAGGAHAVAAGLRRVLDGELAHFSLEYPCPTATAGNWFLTTITPLSGRPCHGAVIAHTGIAARKAAEVALQASEERFRSTFEQAAVGIAHVAIDGRFLRVNDRLCAIVGYAREDLLQLTYASLSLPEDRAQSETARQAMLSGSLASFAMEKRYRRQDGSPVWIDLVTSLARTRAGEAPYFISVMEDISARKTAERRLQRLNRLYAVLSRIGETIVRTHGPLQLYERACRIIVEEGLLDLALVAGPQPGPVASPLAVCARAGERLSSAALARDDGPLVHEAIGAVFRTGVFEMCNDLGQDPRLDAWRAAVAVSGFRSSAAFPLKRGGEVVAALVLFADEVDYFHDDEIALMVAVSNNLSFALDAMHQEGQRHAAEESLRASERRFRALIEHSADGISLVDAGGRALYLSPAAAAIEGRSAAEVLGASRLVDNHPDEVEMVQDLLRELVEHPGASRPALWRRRHAQGHWLWLEGVATNLLADPAVRAIVTNYRDVSARRRADLEMEQSQASLRMASRLGRIGAWALDLPTATLSWSDEVRAIHEVAGDFVPELARALDFYPDEFRPAIGGAVAACSAAGTPFDVETTIVTAKGNRLWIRAIGEAVRDAAGAVVRVQGAFQDISERRKLEQQFLRAQRLESIGTLAGGIAHDLNNVLTPIMLSISLLTLDERDHKRLRILATIDASAKRGADMVKQVLSFARGVEGQRLPVQVSQLLREVEKIANDTFLKNIQVSVVVPPGLWRVVGDATQLHQLLLNLCVNARDAMPDGGTLMLSAANLRLDARTPDLHFEAQPGPHVEIRVEDSGTGMPPEVIEKIFEPFFTTKEIGKGTGLGLSTSLAVVKSHHGSLRVYSEPGKGTTFRIRLPALISAASPSSVEEEPPLPRGHQELILVVDDEPAVRQIVRQTLETFDYRVLLAANGNEAIALYAAQADEIAVVLTDMMMPGLDGRATIRLLDGIRPGVRIIAASGLNSNHVVASAASNGVKHFLAKPYTAESLLTKLHEVLQGG